MQEWEYRCIIAPHSRTKDVSIGGERAKPVSQIESIMNELGRAGWELIGVQTPYPTYSENTGAVLFFKRPKP